MVIRPKVKGFICTTSHPDGCAQNIKSQIDRVKSYPPVNHGGKVKNVLVIGGSTGYGLSSRLVSSFLLGAGTLNVCLERPATESRTASPGWYNTAYFEQEVASQGLYAKTVLGDAFSDEVKYKTIATIKNDDLPKIDLVIYSLAAPRRTDPRTGETYSSVLKPVGEAVIAKSLNPNNGELTEVKIDPATPDQVEATVKVMGGEDWQAWIELLEKKDVLSDSYLTIAYSYIGPEVTYAIYRNGTIGKAKEHLERTAVNIIGSSEINGRAVVSVNKALVTHASSAIPILPLYVSALYKVMKSKGIHEGCIEQIIRLFGEKIDYGGSEDGLSPIVDEVGMIRLDDWEMKSEVQDEIKAIWDRVNQDNVLQNIDFEGYQQDFYRLFGFNWEGVDYEAETNEKVDIKGVIS